MAKLNHYIPVGKKRLRCGYTTGTCAAAAARGAAEYLVSGMLPAAVEVMTPAGIAVCTDLLDGARGADWACCAVEKDAGDDYDVTDGMRVYARVERRAESDILICGGSGVGRVTKPGLDQPPGEAAINRMPRQMIRDQLTGTLEKYNASGGFKVTISIPEGERLAKKTFNPRLGIEGGLSVLGTSGIVRPMSEQALVDSMNLEIDMRYASGARDLLITPGNYGDMFSETLKLSLTRRIQCSNYIGACIDYVAGKGMRSALVVGHLGKLIKVAAGSMNTHSSMSDGRRESLCTHAALQGASLSCIKALYDCPTTEAAIPILDEAELREPVMASITGALDERLKRRAGEQMRIEAVLFTNQCGILGKTNGAEALMTLHRTEDNI